MARRTFVSFHYKPDARRACAFVRQGHRCAFRRARRPSHTRRRGLPSRIRVGTDLSKAKLETRLASDCSSRLSMSGAQLTSRPGPRGSADAAWLVRVDRVIGCLTVEPRTAPADQSTHGNRSICRPDWKVSPPFPGSSFGTSR